MSPSPSHDRFTRFCLIALALATVIPGASLARSAELVGQAVTSSGESAGRLAAVWGGSVVQSDAEAITVVLENSRVFEIASHSAAQFDARSDGGILVTVNAGTVSYSGTPGGSRSSSTLVAGESVAFDEDGAEDRGEDFLPGVVAVLTDDVDEGQNTLEVDATESIRPTWPLLIQSSDSNDCAVLDIESIVDDTTVELVQSVPTSYASGSFVIQGEQVQEAMDDETCEILAAAKSATPGGAASGRGNRAVWIGLGAAAAAVTGYEVLDDDDGEREPTTVAEPDLLPPE